MTALLVLSVSILVSAGWFRLRKQIRTLDVRLSLSSEREQAALERQVAKLSGRIIMLEQQLANILQDRASAASQATSATLDPAARRISQPAPTKVAEVAPAPALPLAPAAEAVSPRIEDEPAPIFPSTPSSVPASSRHNWSDWLRQLIGDREWETLVAGSVMNKLGALLLVIGIALFLGYSFTRVNRSTRAATAALISAGILTGGVILERRQQYRLFSRGLIGAGWAALYTTTYAIYALPAAQIISNSFAGSILLLTVSAAMIAHSLRYRSQSLTAIAYFSAFAALGVTPSTPFAVESLVPLAASLLYFAWRFEWYAMGLFGLFATYATCISRGSSNAPLYATTSLFITYWLLFESFDILRSRRATRGVGLTWIFPLNATAFLGLSYQAWSLHNAPEMWAMAALAACLFLASALLRIRVRPANVETAVTDPFDCIRRGTYEPPLALAAVLAGLAILGRVTGFWTNIALAFEAEILFLAGVRFRSRFLRALANSGFGASLGDAIATSSRNFGSVSLLGVSLHNWTPSLLVHAFLFYLNRKLWRAIGGYSFAATALVTIVIASELSLHRAPFALFAFAIGLLEFGLRKRLIEFRIQSYLVACAAALLVLLAGGFAPHAPASVWGLSATSALVYWLFTARILSANSEELHPQEAARVRDLFAIAGSGFALLTLWMLLPGPWTAFAWTALALAWLAIASRRTLPSFLWIAAGTLALVYARLLVVNFTLASPAENLLEQWLIPLFVTGALYVFWHRFRHLPQALERSFAPLFTWLAATVVLWLLYIEVDRLYLVSAWAALALALLIAGLRTNVRAFRSQSYLVMALAAGSCQVINFADSGKTDMFGRIFGASLLIALLFTAQFLLPRTARQLGAGERHARTTISIVAVSLLTSLLYHEVSGGLLTVAWGLEAVACLGAGFPARERLLRLEGLALFTLCILKLFLYDLRNLETVYRILSFIALGVILLSISWIYTRFRTRIQRYL